jgi:flagellar hook-associated protein 2
MGIVLSDTTGDFLAKTRLLTANSGALSRGNNLIYKVNDTGPLVSQGNTIDQNSSGIQGLAVTATKASAAARISSVDTSGEAVTTEESHGFSTGDAVTLYSPGTLPGGLATDTTYYVNATSNTTFTLHTTKTNAENNTNAVDLTSAQSGDVYFLGSSPSIATVSVQSDTKKIKESIASLITTLNKVQSMIAAQVASSTDKDGKVTLGVLAGEPMATGIARELRAKAVQDVTGITGTIKRLESIGYTTSGYTNQITLSDETSLDTALRDNLGQVETLFTTTYGLANAFFTFLDNLLDDDGSLATTQENMTDQVTDIDKQIADHERRVQANRQMLIRSFVAMEMAQAKINQQMSFLSMRFNNMR